MMIFMSLVKKVSLLMYKFITKAGGLPMQYGSEHDQSKDTPGKCRLINEK